jgi:hypothetical protein
LWTIKHEALEE